MSCNVVNSEGLGQYIYGFPCPYDSVMDPGPALPALLQATGLSGCGCGCGGECGMGYFDSGFDISGWGFAEWGTGIFAGYAFVSLFMDTKRSVRSEEHTSELQSLR